MVSQSKENLNEGDLSTAQDLLDCLAPLLAAEQLLASQSQRIGICIEINLAIRSLYLI